MGGTASATAIALIDGSTIKKNTVTGKQVKEASLGQVPKAAKAKSANYLTALPSGHSMSGAFSAGGANSAAAGFIGDAITYPRTLKTPIANANIIDARGWPVAHCPEPGKADPGYLCLYNSVYNNVNLGYGYSSNSFVLVNGKSVGVVLYWQSSGANSYAGGIWTVTAP
jgi:hypothetical protein